MITKLILSFIFFAFFSCSTLDKKNEKYLSEHIALLMSSSGRCYNNIVIIPGSGCSGCITVAEDFLKINYKRSNILFILTNITSLKILNHKIGIDVTNMNNIIIDNNNEYFYFNKSIFPTVINYNCEKRQIKNIIFQKPGTNAFDNI